MQPFITRFAKKLPIATPEVIRYDDTRQIAEVFENDTWVDRATTGRSDGLSRQTAVNAETTDDN